MAATRENNVFQWKPILGGLILVVISMAAVTVFELITGTFKGGRNGVLLPQPNVTQKGIEENKGKIENKIQQTEKMNIVQLYRNPLQTPSFVTNPVELTKYLESNTAKVVIVGEISEAYLYIKTGPIDINRESVYFWIVDGTSDGGHLSPTENLAGGNGNEFLYDLTKLPVVDMPYSLQTTPSHHDIINNFLNKDISYKSKREYYIGGFVSTTQLPNEIDSLEIRYLCKQITKCSIILEN